MPTSVDDPRGFVLVDSNQSAVFHDAFVINVMFLLFGSYRRIRGIAGITVGSNGSVARPSRDCVLRSIQDSRAESGRSYHNIEFHCRLRDDVCCPFYLDESRPVRSRRYIIMLRP